MCSDAQAGYGEFVNEYRDDVETEDFIMGGQDVRVDIECEMSANVDIKGEEYVGVNADFECELGVYEGMQRSPSHGAAGVRKEPSKSLAIPSPPCDNVKGALASDVLDADNRAPSAGSALVQHQG